MKHLSVLDTLYPSGTILSQEEYVENMLAIESFDHDIKSMSQQTDQALDLVVSLENLSEVIQQIKKITPAQNALIQIASGMAMAGSDVVGDQLIPALESEDSNQNVVVKLKQKIAAIIDAIVAFAKKIWEMFKSFLSKVADNFSSNASHIEKLQERFSKFDKAYKDVHPRGYSSKPSVEKITVKPVLRSFKARAGGSISIGYENPKAIASDVQEYVQFITRFAHNESDVLRQDISKAGDRVVAVLNGDVDKIKDILPIIQKYTKHQQHDMMGGFQITMGLDEEEKSDGHEDKENLAYLLRSLRVKTEAPADQSESVEMDLMSLVEIEISIEALKKINKLLDPSNANGVITSANRLETQNKQVLQTITSALNRFEKSNLDKGQLEIFDFAKSIVPEFMAWASNHSTAPASALVRNTSLLFIRLINIVQKNLAAWETLDLTPSGHVTSIKGA